MRVHWAVFRQATSYVQGATRLSVHWRRAVLQKPQQLKQVPRITRFTSTSSSSSSASATSAQHAPAAAAAADNPQKVALLSTVLARCRAHSSYFVHFGNCIVLMAISQTDMMNLRALSIGATMCGIAYNLLQIPRPLVAPAMWGIFFIGCHSYQILELLRERQEVKLSAVEKDAYEQAFLRFGFTQRQFLDLLEGAAPQSGGRCAAIVQHRHKEMVHTRGDVMDNIHFVMNGEVEVRNYSALCAASACFLTACPCTRLKAIVCTVPLLSTKI
jgi:hypothetical protein